MPQFSNARGVPVTTVVTPGTKVQLPNIRVGKVELQARGGDIYVSGSDVDAALGIGALILDGGNYTITFIDNLGALWIDSLTANAKVGGIIGY